METLSGRALRCTSRGRRRSPMRPAARWSRPRGGNHNLLPPRKSRGGQDPDYITRTLPPKRDHPSQALRPLPSHLLGLSSPPPPPPSSSLTLSVVSTFITSCRTRSKSVALTLTFPLLFISFTDVQSHICRALISPSSLTTSLRGRQVTDTQLSSGADLQKVTETEASVETWVE